MVVLFSPRVSPRCGVCGRAGVRERFKVSGEVAVT